MTDNLADRSIPLWFYSAPDGRKGPFTVEQIQTLVQAEVVDAHTLMWSEAVSDWTPLFRTDLRSLLGNTPILPPDRPEPHTGSATAPPLQGTPLQDTQRMAKDGYHPQLASSPLYRNDGLANWVNWTFQGAGFSYIAIAIIILMGSVNPAQWNTELSRQLARAQMFNSNHPALLLVWLAYSIIPFTLLVVWKYRVTINVVKIYGPQTITPAGAVYWYFVPVLFFWKPYEAMSNIWRAYALGDRYILSWWWTLWIGVWVLSGIVMAISPEVVRTVGEARLYVFGELACWMMDAGSCFASSAVAKRIAAAERMRTGG
ncbi:DUF4328 domain-containing protein [Pannonibacter phragmitetus]|uniref:DUF4328 domain-containing protein n=1 Tax=Pannonibacter phragmitetus TaxID=121719 RepID=UPI000F456D8E|nr:DUF4328 domain-containing protein [Pannonibacter phragmitetus]MBA4207831.1 hypothetical protein [Polymorphum sp.]